MKFEKISGTQNRNLFRPTGSKKIWVRVFRSGKGRLEKSTGTEVLTVAREKRDKIVARFSGQYVPEDGQFLVEEKFEQFLELKKDAT